jgi:hypothetical protein
VNNTLDPLLRNGWDLAAIKKKFGGDVFAGCPRFWARTTSSSFNQTETEYPRGSSRLI